MDSALQTLLITAAGLGFIHTVLGPDHYIPFVALSKSRNWSNTKTVFITFLCGLGHVLSSVVIGIIGILFGVAISKIEGLESFRGDIAAWALTAFGLVYLVWGIRRAYKNKGHTHLFGHSHEQHDHASDGEHRSHTHGDDNHTHDHDHDARKSITPWVIFLIFVFGPCEPLIPLLMYPAAQSSMYGMVLVASVFSIVTIGTMITAVMILLSGLKVFDFSGLTRYSHAIAGLTILLCGVAIHLGL